ncbi:MAG: NAD(P)/FAD-dependent oxidoreductase [Chitinophagaceae bacterium]
MNVAPQLKKPKLVVIGGGAAGFFCAINAAKANPNLEVTIVEKNNKLLSKVKISGGGRCNVTHACFEIDELVKKYPRGEKFLKKAFHWFNTKHTVHWFENKGVQLKIEADGRMFPITDSSQTIINCLLNEADACKVKIALNCTIERIQNINGKWFLQSNTNTIEADYLCIAAGGFPKLSQFDWLAFSGHSIVSPVPSLFTFNIPNSTITELMGICIPQVNIKLSGTKFNVNGPILITHWGFSGPAVLRLSALAATELAAKAYQFSITINWLGSIHEAELREQWQHIRNNHRTQKIGARNPFGLPNRFWQYLLQTISIPETNNWSEITQTQQNKLITLLTNYQFNISGKTTFKEEFVTAGGIELQEIDANTMESKKQPNLYFAGEILNIDGITGGFNFQNAWTTGFIAAKSIATKSLEI